MRKKLDLWQGFIPWFWFQSVYKPVLVKLTSNPHLYVANLYMILDCLSKQNNVLIDDMLIRNVL